ncbi:alpha,alpha-trehalase nth1 [Elasticomyces elasticus]|nr:alpha,alpha-trehalase nth1 [Elasticomyces elasticus]KAK4971513.1 alpha,alpha-trehalase nth1 [Elasticomyces elasticus]
MVRRAAQITQTHTVGYAKCSADLIRHFKAHFETGRVAAQGVRADGRASIFRPSCPPIELAATRQSRIRGFAADEDPKDDRAALSKTVDEADGSDVKSASIPTGATVTLGKRKRQPVTNKLSVETTSTRRSPRKAQKLEPNEEDHGVERKARRQPAKRIKGPNGTVAVEPPLGWETIYEITAAMRKRVLAPVDTMGCESLAEESRSPLDRRLQTLVALMLSSQTKDTVTAVAMKNLQDNLEGGFCLESLLEVEPEVLNELIGKVGFHNNKTKFIKAVAIILRDKFSGDIPDTVDGLISLPGVGPKMAYLTMSAAWGKTEGIGVDVHVHRITNLWGWHKTSTPEQTRAELEAWLPREKWHDINHLLVGFGQTICLPIGRRCGECDLAKEKLCPSAVEGSPAKRRVKKEVVVKVKEDVTAEKIVVESDDLGIKVEADLITEGHIEDIQAVAGT